MYGKLDKRSTLTLEKGCPGGAAARRQTCDWKVAGSTPSWGAIKSTSLTQPSVPSG